MLSQVSEHAEARSTLIQDAFTQADYAVSITDPSGRILEVNPAYLKLYKFASETEIVGRTQSIIRSPSTPDSLYREMWETITSGNPWRGDLVNKARDGCDVHTHLTITPIFRNEKIEGYMGFSLDRSQQVMLERQLLHANKLMILGTLGAGLAHEMNNPLASILLDAEYLKEVHSEEEHSFDQASALAAAESVIRGVERMRRVLKHLLQYSRNEVVSETGKVSIKALVEDSLLFLDRQLMCSGIEIHQEIEEHLFVVGNPTQLESVLHNLITNARDAFALAQQEHKQIRISAGRIPEARIEIIFEDNAGGIRKDHIDRIFDPFFTTKEERMGTGLGLSLSRKIVSDHGGDIECESTQGCTRFTLHFPDGSDSSKAVSASPRSPSLR